MRCSSSIRRQPCYRPWADRTGWILWALILFVIAGAAFMAQVVPLQRRMAALARAAAADGGSMDWAAYHAMSRRWDLWGGIALATPAIVLVLMVLKPHLPSF